MSRFCTNCGKNVNGAFCTNCGQKYEEPVMAAPSPAKSFCTNCGAEMTGAFCINCGARKDTGVSQIADRKPVKHINPTAGSKGISAKPGVICTVIAMVWMSIIAILFMANEDMVNSIATDMDYDVFKVIIAGAYLEKWFGGLVFMWILHLVMSGAAIYAAVKDKPKTSVLLTALKIVVFIVSFVLFIVLSLILEEKIGNLDISESSVKMYVTVTYGLLVYVVGCITSFLPWILQLVFYSKAKKEKKRRIN